MIPGKKRLQRCAYEEFNEREEELGLVRLCNCRGGFKTSELTLRKLIHNLIAKALFPYSNASRCYVSIEIKQWPSNYESLC